MTLTPLSSPGRSTKGECVTPLLFFRADFLRKWWCHNRPVVTHVALKPSVRLKGGKLISARIAEVEASTTWKGEYRFSDDPSSLAYRFEGRLQIIHGNDCKRRGSGLASVRLQADVNVTRQRAGVAWTEVGKGEVERIGIE